jgi:hypothetical protein
MHEKRYQIFVSSTYNGLESVRAEVQQTILRINHFPVGMENFLARSKRSWNVIERFIKSTDYYLIIVAGRYGTIDNETGLSYTERELDLAMSLNIPILGFLHKNPEGLPFEYSEQDQPGRDQLEALREKVKVNQTYFWNDSADLVKTISESLHNEFTDNPRAGWVRDELPSKLDLMAQVIDLQKRHDVAVHELDQLKSSQRNDVDIVKLIDELREEVILVSFSPEVSAHISMLEIFVDVAPEIMLSLNMEVIRNRMSQLLHKRLPSAKQGLIIEKTQLKSVLGTLTGLGLATIEFTGNTRLVQLTALGALVHRRATRTLA